MLPWPSVPSAGKLKLSGYPQMRGEPSGRVAPLSHGRSMGLGHGACRPRRDASRQYLCCRSPGARDGLGRCWVHSRSRALPIIATRCETP